MFNSFSLCIRFRITFTSPLTNIFNFSFNQWFQLDNFIRYECNVILITVESKYRLHDEILGSYRLRLWSLMKVTINKMFRLNTFCLWQRKMICVDRDYIPYLISFSKKESFYCRFRSIQIKYEVHLAERISDDLDENHTVITRVEIVVVKHRKDQYCWLSVNIWRIHEDRGVFELTTKIKTDLSYDEI